MKASSPPQSPPQPPVLTRREPAPAPNAPARIAATAAIWRAMFLKEARELFPWLALCSGGTALVLILTLFTASLHVAQGAANQIIALPPYYFLVSIFAPANAALFLGFIQFFPELRAARLGLLFHRPAARTTLFSAKLFTGIALYLLALGLPLFIALLWTSSPQHMPFPFSWSMALVPLADLLSGIPCYLAGTLIALRTDARWLGSRITPAAIAILGAFLNFLSTHVGWSILVTAIAISVMLPAAVTAFHPQPSSRRRPLKARFALGWMLVPALAITCATLLGLSDGLYESLFPIERAYTNYTRGLLKDGTPIISAYNGITRTTTLLDPAGKLIRTVPQSAIDDSIFLHQYINMEDYDNYQARMFHEPYHYFYPVGTAGNAWYRPNDGRYVVGYDATHRRLIGSIGPGGFFEGAAVPPILFPQPIRVFHNSLIAALAEGDTLYNIANDHALSPVFTTPDHQTILNATALGDGVQHMTSTPSTMTALVTQSSVWFISRGSPPRVFAHYESPNLASKRLAMDYIPTTNEFIIAAADAPGWPTQAQYPATLTYVSATDSSTHTLQLPACTPPVAVTRNQNPFERIAPALFPPAIGAVSLAVYQLSRAPDDGPTLQQMFSSEEPWICLGSAGLVATLTFFFIRHYAFPRRARMFWSVMVLMFGPLTLFLLLSTRGLPRMQRCPTCGKPRPLDENLCPHCAAAFPLPAPDATEIFA